MCACTNGYRTRGSAADPRMYKWISISFVSAVRADPAKMPVSRPLGGGGVLWTDGGVGARSVVLLQVFRCPLLGFVWMDLPLSRLNSNSSNTQPLVGEHNIKKADDVRQHERLQRRHTHKKTSATQHTPALAHTTPPQFFCHMGLCV